MAKEEAFLQVTSANNRADALQMQLTESEDTITALRREKQVLETELSVIRVCITMITYVKHKYSQTCEQRSPQGETSFGLYRQVVLIWGLFALFFQ